MTRVLVVGVGNPDRGDDTVGWLVAETLRDRLAAHPGGAAADVEVVATSADPSALLTLPAWDTAERLIVVDAAVSGAPVGHVHRHDDPDRLPVPVAGGSHDLGLASTLALARALGRRPPRVEVIAVEGRCFGVGDEPSPAVRLAAAALVEELLAELVADDR